MAKKVNFKDYLKALKLIRINPELKNRFDENGDGSLDPDELEKGAATLGQEINSGSTSYSRLRKPPVFNFNVKDIRRKYRRSSAPQAVERMSWLELLQSFRYSPLLLILVNIIPLIYVLFFGWKVFTLILLYWAENIIIGIFNVFKMIKVEKRENVLGVTWVFFMFHYGFFSLVHGVLVFAMFGPEQTNEVSAGTFILWSWIWEQRLFLAGLVGLSTHHFASYLIYFIGAGEYKYKKLKKLMFAPYGRVAALHLAIIFGGTLVQNSGEPIWALVVLVGVKISLDLVAHLFSHMPTNT